jgi:hypothetical protein
MNITKAPDTIINDEKVLKNLSKFKKMYVIDEKRKEYLKYFIIFLKTLVSRVAFI